MSIQEEMTVMNTHHREVKKQSQIHRCTLTKCELSYVCWGGAFSVLLFPHCTTVCETYRQ